MLMGNLIDEKVVVQVACLLAHTHSQYRLSAQRGWGGRGWAVDLNGGIIQVDIEMLCGVWFYIFIIPSVASFSRE